MVVLSFPSSATKAETNWFGLINGFQSTNYYGGSGFCFWLESLPISLISWTGTEEMVNLHINSREHCDTLSQMFELKPGYWAALGWGWGQGTAAAHMLIALIKGGGGNMLPISVRTKELSRSQTRGSFHAYVHIENGHFIRQANTAEGQPCEACVFLPKWTLFIRLGQHRGVKPATSFMHAPDGGVEMLTLGLWVCWRSSQKSDDPPTKEEYEHVPSNFSLRLKMRVYTVTYSLYGKAQRKLCRQKSHAGSNKTCLCVVCVPVVDTVQSCCYSLLRGDLGWISWTSGPDPVKTTPDWAAAGVQWWLPKPVWAQPAELCSSVCNAPLCTLSPLSNLCRARDRQPRGLKRLSSTCTSHQQLWVQST